MARAKPFTKRRMSATAGRRLTSIDAYRGIVMFLMLAEVLRFAAVSAARPESAFWRFVAGLQTHAAWTGCSLHDLIQPGFYFLVGVALPFSIAARRAQGQEFADLLRHALVRALVLIVLGMVLVSLPQRRWVWWFDDTLTQIGLAYPFVFLLAFRPARDRGVAFAAVLAGYWLWFAQSPLPPADFDYTTLDVPPGWLQQHGLSGFAAHWQNYTNPAAVFDRWLLNLFPRKTPFLGDVPGLTTLNFIPSIATMLLGVFAGERLRGVSAPWHTVREFVVTGFIALSGGWLLDAVGLCPIAKPIWTPAWVLFSGGWCFLILATLYALTDIRGIKRPFFPFIVIGANSILAYCLSHVFPAVAFNAGRRILGPEPFRVLGAAYEPAVYGAFVLLGYWLVLFVLYRWKIFVRI
jgi:heparan-alpha-glucosaminide N-acetyltransferase